MPERTSGRSPLSREEIESGIRKLKRRLQEVEGLAGLRYNDSQVGVVESNVRTTITEVFGENSPQQREHPYFTIRLGTAVAGLSASELQQLFDQGIPRAKAQIGGLLRQLEEQTEDLETDSQRRILSAFEGLRLHPRIAKVSCGLYRDGHYSEAVFEASKALVNYVRDLSGRHDLDGHDLMSKVFGVGGADFCLAFNELDNKSDKSEQQGMMHLFQGAVLAIRNPRGHQTLETEVGRALECLCFLSFLAYRLQSAKKMSSLASPRHK